MNLQSVVMNSDLFRNGPCTSSKEKQRSEAGESQEINSKCTGLPFSCSDTIIYCNSLGKKGDNSQITTLEQEVDMISIDQRVDDEISFKIRKN